MARVQLVSDHRTTDPRCLGVTNKVSGSEGRGTCGSPIIHEQDPIGRSDEMTAECHALRLVVEVWRGRTTQKRLADGLGMYVVSDLGETHAEVHGDKRPNDEASRFDANDDRDGRTFVKPSDSGSNTRQHARISPPRRLVGDALGSDGSTGGPQPIDEVLVRAAIHDPEQWLE